MELKKIKTTSMKPFILFLLSTLAIFISSCSNDTTSDNVNNKSATNNLKGIYIRVSDNDRAGFEKDYTLIKEIEFKGKYCHFDYASIKMTGKFDIDENYVYIDANNEIGILSMEIINGDHLEGEGFIHGTFKRK